MEFQDIKTNHYNLHLIKTKKFKTVSIRVDFRRKSVKEEITKRNVVADMLMRSTASYKTEREMVIKSEELYNTNYMYNVCLSGNYSIMSYDITSLADNYSEEGNVEKSIMFLMDMLFNPLIKNNSFDKDTLDISLNYIRKYIEDIYDNPRKYAKVRLRELMAPSSPFSFHQDGYIEDLEMIDESNLYEYYKDFVKNDLVDIYVIGDVDESIKEIFDKYFVYTRKNMEAKHFISLKTRSNVKKKLENKMVRQSTLMVGFKIEDTSLFEKQYVSTVYSFILGGSPDSKLFMNVREKMSLCYSISSVVAPVTNSMFIGSGIDKKDYKKALKEINKQIECMANGEFSEEDINNAKATYKSGCLELFDSQASLLNSKSASTYVGFDNLEDRIKKIDEVTYEDVVEFAKKVKLDAVFLLKGVLDEKD